MFRTKPASLVKWSLLLCLAVSPAPLRADEATKQIFRQTLKATSYVECKTGAGTAWVVDKNNRLLVTNEHVVKNATDVLVLFPIFENGKLVAEAKAYKNERGFRGKVIDTDTDRDLAVIQLIDRIPEEVGELKLASTSAEAGDRVHSIGNPSASDAFWIYTQGIVRSVYAKEWSYVEFQRRARVYRKARIVETQSPLNHGDSGGPVVNDQGAVVAVVSGGRTKDDQGLVQLMSWTIDVTEVRAFVDQTRRLLSPKTPAELTERADRLIKMRRDNEAIDLLDRALKQNRNFAQAYAKRAEALGNKHDYDTAIADCNEAIRLDKENAFAFQLRGWMHDELKQYDKAVADYTRAIQLDSKYATAYNNRGVVYYRKKDYTRAKADYTRAVELDPKNAVAWANRANAHFDLREDDAAFADANRAINIDPFHRQGWELRGWSLREKGKLAEAAENFTVAIKFDPNIASYYLNRGFILSKLNGKLAQAVADYDKAIQLDSEADEAYFRRGQAFESVGSLADAQKDYRKAVDLDSKWNKQLQSFKSRFIRVANETAEPIRVYVKYEYQTTKGDWVWYPTDTPKDFWRLAPGETAYLNDNNWQVKARRFRIWAVGEKSGNVIDSHRNQDVWIAPQDGYLATKTMTFLYRFVR